MALTVDFVAQRIRVTAPQTQLTIQELYDFCKDSELTDTGMAYNTIAVAAGKDVISPGVQVAITMRLLENWQLEWWAGNYTAILGGGNIVAECGDPVAYVQGGPQVEITLSAAATIVSADGGGSSGLTIEEHTALMSIEVAVGLLLANQCTKEEFKSYLFDRANTVVGGRITRYHAGADVDVNVTYDSAGIPTAEAIDE
jgi:hypothetical protein